MSTKHYSEQLPPEFFKALHSFDRIVRSIEFREIDNYELEFEFDFGCLFPETCRYCYLGNHNFEFLANHLVSEYYSTCDNLKRFHRFYRLWKKYYRYV